MVLDVQRTHKVYWGPDDTIWVTVAFNNAFWMCTEVVYLLRCLRLTYLVPRETAAISARSVYTIQPCMTSCHFAQSHVGWAHACLAVTCHLHFWQTDRDFFTCYCGADTEIRVSTDSWPWGRKFYLRFCPDWTRDLSSVSITRLAL